MEVKKWMRNMWKSKENRRLMVARNGCGERNETEGIKALD